MSTQRMPSKLLTALASSLPSEVFLRILRRTICPALDSLPSDSRSNLVTILEMAQKDHEIAARNALINYGAMEKELQDLIKKALNQRPNVNGHVCGDGASFDKHAIADSIIGWLPTLWTIGVEDGMNLMVVHKCLKLCYATAEQILNIHGCNIHGSRPISIKDKFGTDVYLQKTSWVHAAIIWVWRELLLVTLSNSEIQTRTLIDDIIQLGALTEIEVGMPKGTKSHADYPGHWSVQTRTAAEQLKLLFSARRIAVFEGDPTWKNYHALISASSDLKPLLLDIAKQHFLQRKETNAWGQGVEILKDAGSSKDLFDILEVMRDVPCISLTARAAKRDAVSYLMVKSTEDRVNARPHLEYGLDDAMKGLRNEMEGAFPGLDKAYEYLDRELDPEGLSKDETPSIYFRRRRPILEKFIKLASEGGDCDLDHQGFGACLEDSISADDDCDQGRKDLDPAREVRGWIRILDKWPNAAEADEIRRKIVTGRNDPFYAVDGVAHMLADRCGFDSTYSKRKLRIAAGIRAAYSAFGPRSSERRPTFYLPIHEA